MKEWVAEDKKFVDPKEEVRREMKKKTKSKVVAGIIPALVLGAIGGYWLGKKRATDA